MKKTNKIIISRQFETLGSNYRRDKRQPCISELALKLTFERKKIQFWAFTNFKRLWRSFSFPCEFSISVNFSSAPFHQSQFPGNFPYYHARVFLALKQLYSIKIQEKVFHVLGGRSCAACAFVKRQPIPTTLGSFMVKLSLKSFRYQIGALMMTAVYKG